MKQTHLHKLIFLFFLFFAVKGYGQTSMPDSNMVKQLFFAGLREKMSENYTVASGNFTKIISIDPSNHAAYFELANADLRLNKLLEAEQNIKQAVKYSPDNPWYWRLLGEVYKRTDNMPELVVVFNELIRIDPKNDAYYFDKANAQIRAGQADAAQKTFAEIETRFGSSRALTAAKQQLPQSAKSASGDVIKLLEGNQADVKNYLYAAGLLLQKGNEDEALKVLLKAQQLEPDNYEVSLSLADVYRKKKDDKASFTALTSAFQRTEMPLMDKLKIMAALFPKMENPLVTENLYKLGKILADKYPTDAKALSMYGDILYQQNKLQEALVQYQSALKQSEQVYAVWEQIINIQTLLGHYADAIKTGDEALTLYPNQAGLYYFMAYALFKSGKNDLALGNLKNALQLDTENKSFQAQVYALQGEIYINQNNFSLAKTAFEKAMTTEPDNFLIMNNYAYYLALKNDDLVKAAKLADVAANALPGNSSISDTYAYILFKQQKYQQALIWIEKALQNNNTRNSVYLEHYGDILFMKGDKDAALIQWQNAKAAGSSSELLIKKINEKKYFK